MSDYDSAQDTYLHIGQVRGFIMQVVNDLHQRASDHDKSKLEEPEKSVFDEFTPKLRNSTYGSNEYQGFLKAMGEGLQHHYEVNDHHPEHFPGGVHDMNLVQMMEMLCDWKAATLRHENGDLGASIQANAERFGYGEEIERLLTITARDMGWL